MFVFFLVSFFVLISFHILSRASIFKETALCRSIENQNPLIYTVPETSASVIAEPMEGETLIIEKKAGLWYYVKTINNTYGWIQKDFLLFYHNK
ncbi:SH3 domain-containing protein [Treponema phagedenis]|uniref:SH3 domain-containing protein n=1 Tax=Treponema phagedenis TaxID=162 RepID=UPI0015A55FBE|nr:SH3 domain-containing protein [Treponema phagedenis]NVP25689.1 SH3 domain-containing protein [Treponema phagedenis]